MAMNNTRTNLLRKQAHITLGADHDTHTTTTMTLCLRSRLCVLNDCVTQKHAVSDIYRILNRLPKTKFITFAGNQRVTVERSIQETVDRPSLHGHVIQLHTSDPGTASWMQNRPSSEKEHGCDQPKNNTEERYKPRFQFTHWADGYWVILKSLSKL